MDLLSRAAIVLLAAMCAAPEAMQNVGGRWWVEREPTVVVEAGRKPRALHRETGGGRVRVDDAIEEVLYVEPDCVVYQTARVSHRVFAVCGDRTPVAIADSIGGASWQFRRDALHRRLDETAESIAMRDIIDLAMRQPPYRRDWAASAAPPSMTPVRTELALDPHTPLPGGNTPLIDAIVRDRADRVEAVLAAGADPNARAASSGATALMIAAGRGELAYVERLLAAKADVSLRDNSGATALIYAAGAGDAGIVRRLLAAGADRSVRDEHGRTAYDYASNDTLRALLKP